MPIIRRPRAPYRRPAARKYRPARRYALAARRPMRSIKYNKVPSFVETLTLENPIFSQAGGVFAVRFNQIPQVLQYATLYRQYRINWFKVTLLPDWNSFDVKNTTETINAPRMVFAIDDTGNAAPPVNEADVLEDNGCKIIQLTKPVSMSCRPSAAVGMNASTGGNVYTNKKMRWLDVTRTDITHSGIRYWISNGGTPIAFRVYIKVSFSLKDPQ